MSSTSWVAQLPQLSRLLVPATARSVCIASGGGAARVQSAVVCANEGQTSVVRIASLDMWKRMCLRIGADDISCVIQELEPAVPFTVALSELNDTGRLLAVAGEYRVAVIVLPTPIKYASAFARVKDSTNNLKREARMYDVSTDPTEPEQVACFSDQSEFSSSFSTPQKSKSPKAESSKSPPSKTKSKGRFGIDCDEREAVSFAIPRKGDQFAGWNSLTVYGLMKSGDIYAVCPFAPRQSAWNVEWLKHLKALHDEDCHSNIAADDTFTTKQLYWRGEWLQEAINSASKNQESRLPGETATFCISYGLMKKLKVARQGPILVAPEQNIEEEFSACDLAVSAVGGIPVFAVSRVSGIVVIGIETSSPVTKWEVQTQVSFPFTFNILRSEFQESMSVKKTPSIYIHEQIEISTPSKNNREIKIYADPKYSDTFHVTHCQGVHSISVESWMNELTKSVTEENMQIVLNNEKMLSNVECTIDFFDQNPSPNQVTGFAIVPSELLGYSCLLSTMDNKIFGRELMMRTAAGINEPQSKDEILRSKFVDSSKLKSLLQYDPEIKTTFEIPRVLSKPGSLIVAKVPSGAEENSQSADPPLDPALVRTLAAKTSALRTQIAAITDAGSVVSDRVEDVQAEALQQRDIVSSYADALDSAVGARTETLLRRAAALKVRQEALNRRVDVVLQLLLDAAQPELNEAELEFFAELRDMASRVRSILKPRMAQIRKQKQVLLMQVDETLRGTGVGGLSSLSDEIIESSGMQFTNKQVETIQEALAKECLEEGGANTANALNGIMRNQQMGKDNKNKAVAKGKKDSKPSTTNGVAKQKPTKSSAPPPKPAPKKVPVKEESSDDSDSDSDSDSDKAPAKKPAAKVAKKEESSDSDSSDDEPPKKVAAPAKKTVAVKADDSDDSDSDSDEDEKPAPKAKAAPAPVKKAPAKKEESESEDSEDESSEDEKPAAKVAPAKKSAAKKEDSESEESDSDDEEEEAKPSAAAKKATPAKKDESSDEESSNDEEDTDEEMKEAKQEDSDEDEDEDEEGDDEEEEVEKPSSKKRAAPEAESTPKKQKVSDSNESTTCFVGNLSFNADEDMVKEHFAECGEVVGVRIVLGPDGRKKGYGYVEFADAESAKKALEMAGSSLDGREIRIDLSTPRPERKAETPKSEASDTLFVGNLSFDATVEDVQAIFAEHGEVTSCRIPTDRESGNPKGFGYVTFASVDAAKAALESLNGYEYLNRALRLDFSAPRTQNDGGRGGFRGGRGGFGGDRGRGGFGDRGRGGRGGRGGGRGGFGGDRGGRGGRGGFGDRGRGGRGGAGRGGFSAQPSGKKTTFE
ncbi:hypothetical protein HDU84_003301 [Entophlyctis sp. JEL0112]|nr:hypothetical protein HDU84_003301 [Entophlyctis sp. JEL0112]